ncbi:hypothetical protein NM208_g5651 [Fusarium decemcellulare]|uniref:Uncharacterized protein n=1 Tax=Fusarium decemcellulare TaxID=57161 RepID=A0ACC1SG43_9HYPO|nr:hypothetical protein NM208_g5651 [Fusarium decemcellulare]
MTSTEYPDDKREELGGSSGCVRAEMGEEAMEPLSEAEMSAQKRLVRKLDLTLMPMVLILYMLSYLDRNNIAQAKLDSFEKDLGLTGEDFNLALSILNVGYILMQLPSNMILTRVRPSLYIPLWVSIVNGFNLVNRTITLVCTTPPYLLGAVCACFIAWSSDRRAERGFHIIGPVLTAVVGFIITLSVLNVPARYVASFLYVCGCFSANALLYSWSVSSLNQTPEKKACATALINIIGQLGSIWSPYFFDPND